MVIAEGKGLVWSKRATDARASESTLRQWLTDWAQAGVWRHIHSMPVGMLGGQCDLPRGLIVNSGVVRAKHGGELTGLNPTDKAKKGIKHHVAFDGGSLKVA